MPIKIGVIIPFLNSEKFIERALESVYFQTYKVDEVITINDGSIDKSKQLVNKWMSKLPIIYLENSKNFGLSYSLNKAVNYSKSDLIFRLDSDDMWRNNHVKNLVEIYHRTNNNVLIAGKGLNYYKDKPINVSKFSSNSIIRKQLLWDNPLIASGTAFTKNAFLKVGGFKESLSIANDYNFYVEILKYGNFSFYDEISVNYYINKLSLSHLDKSKSLNERLKIEFKAIKIYGLKYIFRTIVIFPILLIRFLIKL